MRSDVEKQKLLRISRSWCDVSACRQQIWLQVIFKALLYHIIIISSYRRP